MENTNLNKAKFFAQYWGQQVMCWEVNDSSHKYKIIGKHNFPIEDRDYLELTPLSMISDSNLLEMLKLSDYPHFTEIERTSDEIFICPNEKFVEDNWNTRELIRISIQHSTVHYDNMESYEDNTCYDLGLAVYDFLRSKSIALPFLGLSVEELANRNWIKLKTE